MGAEANAMRAQPGARRLIEAFDLVSDFLALQHTEGRHQLERNASGNASNVLGFAKGYERAKQLVDVRLEPLREARLDAVARRASELLVGEDAKPRLQRIV